MAIQAEMVGVGLRPEPTTPIAKKRLRKERTLLAGAPLKELKPRAKKPKSDDAVRITPDLDKYKVNKEVLTASGNPSIDIGDATAKLLRGKALDEVYRIVTKLLDTSEKSLDNRYTYLNAGQQCMTLGNRRRGEEGEDVKMTAIALALLTLSGAVQAGERCTLRPRDGHGRIVRSEQARREFEYATGHPHGWRGHIIDHITPLKCGGADAPSNMQWQTRADAAAKDQWETRGCTR